MMRRFFFSTIKALQTLKLFAQFNVANTGVPTGTTMDVTYGVDPGELVPTYTDGSFNITSNKLAVGAQTTPVWGDQYIQSPELYNTENDTLTGQFQRTSAIGTRFSSGLQFNSAISLNKELIAGFQLGPDGFYLSAMGNFIRLGQFIKDDNYELKIVLGSYDDEGNLTGDLRFGYRAYLRTVGDRWRMLGKIFAFKPIPPIALGVAATGWEDFPPSGSTLAPTIVGGFIRMYDNITTLDQQVRVRTLAAVMADHQILIWTIRIDEINDTSSWNPSDLSSVNVAAADTGDNPLNRVGVSFPIVHQFLNVRAQIWFQKAQDHGTSGNFELWKVVDNAPNFTFVRIWVGNNMTMGVVFTFEIEYHFNGYNAYICTVTTGGNTLVSNETIGMNANTAGNGSVAVQAKGTAAEPVDVSLQGFKQIVLPNHRFNLSNFDSAITVDDVRIETIPLAITIDYSGTITEGTNFEHSLNCLFDLQCDVYSLTEALTYAFRYVDASNYYFLNVSTAGVITLNLRLAGVDSVINTSAINAVALTRLQLRVTDDVARLFIDNRLGFGNTGIPNFPTEQTFNFLNIPADAPVKNLVCEKVNDQNYAVAGSSTFDEVTAIPVDNSSSSATVKQIPLPSAVAGDLLILVVAERSASPTYTITDAANQTWTRAYDLTTSSGVVFFATYNGSFGASTFIEVTLNTGLCPSGFCIVFTPAVGGGAWELDSLPIDFLTPSNTIHNIPGVEVSAFQTVSLAMWIIGSARTYSALTGSGWAVTGTAQYRNLAGSDRTYSFAHKVCGGRGNTGVVGKTMSGAVSPNVGMIVTFRYVV